MEQVIYRTVITIDGRDYTITSCDYTDNIKEAIKDGVVDENNHDMIDYILGDLES